jgi:hypothetical protein
VPPGRSQRHFARSAARVRAIDVVLEGRVYIGDDMVVRDLVARLVPRYVDVRWSTPAAVALVPTAPGQLQVDHVVPVNILVDRLVQGASPIEVLNSGAQCYVTKEEHHSNDGLARFRTRHADLTCGKGRWRGSNRR